MERTKIISFLTGLKRFVIKALIVSALTSIFSFIYFKMVLSVLLKAAKIKVYYFTFPEVFFSSVELAIYAGIFFSMPATIFLLWYEFRHNIRMTQVQGILFALFSIVLFYVGSLFCYSIVLKSGIGFLLSYEGGALKAMISVERFVRFCAAMMFAFGITFEVPVILLILSRLGLVKARMLTGTRRYAILLITIASALITPTPDVYNMMLLAVPTYFLYEVGILLIKMNERGRRKAEQEG
jgi:sec-independent protein translocase protein TatC